MAAFLPLSLPLFDVDACIAVLLPAFVVVALVLVFALRFNAGRVAVALPLLPCRAVTRMLSGLDRSTVGEVTFAMSRFEIFALPLLVLPLADPDPDADAAAPPSPPAATAFSVLTSVVRPELLA